MDIKDLLASFAEIDEMEASDGMNIAETEEMISKENIKNAVINCLNAYDVIVDVEDI